MQHELDTVSSQLGLVPGEYSAVHLRVRYPRGLPLKDQGMLVGKEPDARDADHVGFYGLALPRIMRSSGPHMRFDAVKHY